MHRITTNVIVCKNKAVLIDFERCKIILHPKNVTQFCQFLMKRGIGKNKIKILKALKNYKDNQTQVNFISLRELFF